MPTQDKHSSHIQSAEQINSLAYKLVKKQQLPNTSTHQLTSLQTHQLISLSTHQLKNSKLKFLLFIFLVQLIKKIKIDNIIIIFFINIFLIFITYLHYFYNFYFKVLLSSLNPVCFNFKIKKPSPLPTLKS